MQPRRFGPYTWTYQAVLMPGNNVQPGDSFTIYDFHGYQGSTISAPAGWNAVSQFMTTPPTGVSLLDPDDPATINLHFIYNGLPITNSSPINGLSLGNFLAQSDTNFSGTDAYVYSDHANISPTMPAVGQGPVSVPTVPEPASLGLLGLSTVLLLQRRSSIKPRV